MMGQELVVNAVRSATYDVFATMLALGLESRDPYTELGASGPVQIDALGSTDEIIGLIGLAGEWIGTATICCNAIMACRIASHMLGTDYTEVNEEVLDAICEVVNMIVGGFKTRAEGYLGPLGLSIPTVIYGLRFWARSSGKERWIVTPFACGGDIFEVKICLARNRGLPFRASLAGQMERVR
jgi:chemotaxis protein CheX